jgi:hypothetical protein
MDIDIELDERDNVNPKVFGPPMWKVLYYIAFSYPDNPSYDIRKKFCDFYSSIKYILPCEKCRVHYMQHFKKNPVDKHLDNKESLLRWLVSLNSAVNKSLGKPEIFYNQKYNQILNELKGTRFMDFIDKKILLGIIAALSFYIIYKKLK